MRSPAMKRTLIIAPAYPVREIDGSSMRTMNFVRYFRRMGEVDILCGNGSYSPDGAAKNFANEHFMDLENGHDDGSNAITRIFDKIWRLKSWSTSCYTPEKEIAVRKIILEGNYDFILCRYLKHAYPLLKLEAGIRQRVILDVDDIVTDSLYDAETDHMTGMGRLCKVVDKQVVKRYGKRCLGFGSIVFCSDADRLKSVASPMLPKAHVVPNVYGGLALPANHSSDGYEKVHRLLFVGSLQYLPNLRGISWFVSEVFPRVLAAFPDVTLSVVGRHPPNELARLASRYREIEIHPDVPEIAPFYERCGISVVPLLAGGGTRIKILESGFAGRPVMSTETGAYGLGMTDGREITIFNGSEGFLDGYRRMRGDPEFYRAMAERLFGFVNSNFSFENFRCAMDKVVGRLR